jgi:coenzyme PQQ biosynthesis protein PqqD
VLARSALPRLEDDEPMVVLPERAVKLGGSGREILALCDGTRSALDIVATLRDVHPDVEGLADDIHDFLDEMVRLGVLERRAGAPA